MYRISWFNKEAIKAFHTYKTSASLSIFDFYQYDVAKIFQYQLQKCNLKSLIFWRAELIFNRAVTHSIFLQRRLKIK